MEDSPWLAVIAKSLCYLCLQDAQAKEPDDFKSVGAKVKFLQKLRERKLGIPALSSTAQSSIGKVKPVEKTETEGEKEELVLQDTFAQETAVLIEDPNM